MCDILGVSARHRPAATPTVKGNQNVLHHRQRNRKPPPMRGRATSYHQELAGGLLHAGQGRGAVRRPRLFPTGETLDVKVPLRYRLNSLGRETVIIGGNLLFQKRLEIDIEHLARFQWGEAHKWDQGTMESGGRRPESRTRRNPLTTRRSKDSTKRFPKPAFAASSTVTVRSITAIRPHPSTR